MPLRLERMMAVVPQTQNASFLELDCWKVTPQPLLKQRPHDIRVACPPTL